MTFGELAVALTCFAAQRSAAGLARLRPYYSTIEKLLAANLVADLIGIWLKARNAGRLTPYVGLDRLAFHVQQLCFLAWPVGVAVVAVVVLARRNPRPVLAVGALAVIARIALYPWLRRDRLDWWMLAEQVALVALGVWTWLQLKRHARPIRIVDGERRELPAPWLQEHHKAMGFIIGVEAINLVGPYLIGVANGDGLRLVAPKPAEHWALAQIGYSCLFIGLAIQQGRWRWKRLETGG